jgi:hypothetical protein
MEHTKASLFQEKLELFWCKRERKCGLPGSSMARDARKLKGLLRETVSRFRCPSIQLAAKERLRVRDVSRRVRSGRRSESTVVWEIP